MSVVSNLDDNCFSLATDLLVELCEEVEKAAGEKPTIDDLCELLTWGLRACSKDILADLNTTNFLRFRPEVKKRGKVVLKPGDLLAVPSGKGGGYYFVLFITKNRFGSGFGLLFGKHVLKPPAQNWEPQSFPFPFYCHDDFVVSGRWKVMGNYNGLLGLFPENPPSYHSKKSWPNDARIGPFGSSELPSGELHHIGKEEAEAVGLLTGEFIRGMNGEEFEKLLDRVLKEELRKIGSKREKPRDEVGP